MPESWRLALGTLTALPVRAPAHVDRAVAGRAALLAPVAALPLGAAAAIVLWLGNHAHLEPLAVGLLTVGTLALGTRAFHIDGLADTADGLTGSYERERSLAIMKTGDVGPAGTAAVVVVLGVQAVGFAGLAANPLWAGALVCVSRAVLPLCCLAGIPAARPDGLGNPFAGSVPRLAGVAAWLAAAGIGVGLAVLHHESWIRAGGGFAVATLVIALLLRRAIRRLGGITGDIFGAAIEVTLAALLLAS